MERETQLHEERKLPCVELRRIRVLCSFVLLWKGSSGCDCAVPREPKGSLLLLGVKCEWVHGKGFDLHLGGGKHTTLIFSKAPQRYCRRWCKTKPFLLHQGYAFVFLGENRDFGCGAAVLSSVSTSQHSPLLETHPSCVSWADTRGQERATAATVKSPISQESQRSLNFPWKGD